MNYHFSRLILKLNIDVSLTGIHTLGQCHRWLFGLKVLVILVFSRKSQNAGTSTTSAMLIQKKPELCHSGFSANQLCFRIKLLLILFNLLLPFSCAFSFIHHCFSGEI